jgi:hypothetical protein
MRVLFESDDDLHSATFDEEEGSYSTDADVFTSTSDPIRIEPTPHPSHRFITVCPY